jgi:PAS domain S-box-containing protein
VVAPCVGSSRSTRFSGPRRIARSRGGDVPDTLRVSADRKKGCVHPSSVRAAPVRVAVFAMPPRTVTRPGQDQLREAEGLFREMANGLPLIVWVHNAAGEQVMVNDTFCEFFGVTREQMKGGRWQMLMHPDDAEAYATEFFACVGERRPFHGQVRVKRADGQWRWIESWGRPRVDEAGAFHGFVGTSADITDRKRAEDELRRVNEERRQALQRIEEQQAQLRTEERRREQVEREGEQRYRTLFESIEQGFCILEMIFDHQDRPVDYGSWRPTRPSSATRAWSTRPEKRHGPWFRPSRTTGPRSTAGSRSPASRTSSSRARRRWAAGSRSRPRGSATPPCTGSPLCSPTSPSASVPRTLLRESDRRKDEFIAMLGHELRNPLASIRSATELIKLTSPEDGPLHRAHGVLERQSAHMSRLIDGLLEVSRISRGKIHLDRETLDARKIIEGVLQDRKPEVAAA